MRARTELTWDSDTVEFPHEVRSALSFGKLGVLSADSLEGYAAKRFAHVTGKAKPSGRSHSAMGLCLSAGGFFRRVEHARSLAGLFYLSSSGAADLRPNFRRRARRLAPPRGNTRARAWRRSWLAPPAGRPPGHPHPTLLPQTHMGLKTATVMEGCSSLS